VTDSGLKPDTPTLYVGLLGEDSIVQVYPNGIYHVRADGRASEWKTPRGRPVVKAAANARQVAIGLSGGELIYFELDQQGNLAEVDKKDSGHEITCVEMGAVPAGRQRSRFAAVGGWDNTIRILSLDPEDCMNVLAVLALPAQAESAAMLSMPIGRAAGAPALFLTIGLHNGVMLRARLDPRSGQLSDTRTRFLGAKPVKLFRLPLGGIEGVLALSSRPWAVYCLQNTLQMSPLSYQLLEYGSSFTSEHCIEGLVAIAGTTLRILSLDKLGDNFTSEAIPLRYTPRRIAHHSASGHLVVIESDHNAYGEDEKAQLYEAAGIPPPLPAGTVLPEDEEADGMLMEATVGVPRGGPGKWASCIRVLDPISRATPSLQKVSLGPGCSDIILYTTILGAIGALLPLVHKEDLEFCTALEMHLRQEAPPICGRDQLFFRSSYFPVKGTVDGDFLQMYNALPPDEQRSIADELDRTPAEVSKKIEELMSRII